MLERGKKEQKTKGNFFKRSNHERTVKYKDVLIFGLD